MDKTYLFIIITNIIIITIFFATLQKEDIGSALPLSHLLGDGQFATLVRPQDVQTNEDDDEVWLGEPTAHLNHVVAYHQLVREQMQSMMQSLQDQHKVVWFSFIPTHQ